MHINLKLLAVWLMLLALGLALQVDFSGSNQPSSQSLLSLTDAGDLTRIKLTRASEKNLLVNKNTYWTLSDGTRLDLDIQRSLLGVLRLMEVKREISELPETPQSIAVELTKTDGERLTFSVHGDPTNQNTYISMANSYYQVHIPNSSGYIAQIFDLTGLQLRDRTVFKTHPTSFVSLSIENNGGEITKIFQDEQGISISDIQKMDTAKVYAYLGQYQAYKINEWISSPPSPVTNFLFKISLEDIEGLSTLTFYEWPADKSLYLVQHNNQSFGVITQKRARQLLLPKNQFEKL